MNLSQGTIVDGRYRLLHELGRGGMGAVWRAHHVALNISCAVKFILGDAAQNPEIRGRFEQEAQAAAQLKSPNVVQILDHGVWEGSPYIAMELLEGEDLDHRLRRFGRLPLPAIAPIVAQVARALHKAHAAGLVHRDLKPANVFLCRDDDGEVVKILDFGIAKQTQAGTGSNTKTGSLLGTPYYMSPEQARGTKALDWRSDLWSLAVIVYQCATGRLPFESDAFGDLLVQIMFNPLPVPSQLAEVPPGFDAWWARAATREPEGRFQSAREMADALAQVAGMPAAAGDPWSRSGGAAPSAAQGAAQPVAAISAVLPPPTGGPALTPQPIAAPFMMGPQATPNPAGPLPSMGGAAPTGADLSISTPGVAASPGRRSRAWIPIAAIAVLALAGGGMFMATRGSSPASPAVTAAMETAAAAPSTTAPSSEPAVAPASASAAPPVVSAAPAVDSAAPPITSTSAPITPAPHGRLPIAKPPDKPAAGAKKRRRDDGI